MISDQAELAELIATTKDLIESESTEIALIRNVPTRSPSGQLQKSVPDPQPAKRRYFAGVVADPVIYTRDEGQMVRAEHVIIGEPGDDIREGDTFQIGNRKFKVTEIHPDTSYQVKGWVVERA